MAIKHYTNDELTVKWESEKCTHSGNCSKGLIKVFNPQKRPWVNLDGAHLDEIRNQVKKCPSGALSLPEG